MGKERGTLRVGTNSWHYQVYLWWLAHGGGKKENYAENLCHYCRVIVFWAPLLWFGQIQIYKWLMFWQIVTGTVLIGLAIVFPLIFSLYIVAIGAAFCVGAFCLFVFGFFWCKENDTISSAFYWYFKKSKLWVVTPFTITLALLFAGLYLADFELFLTACKAVFLVLVIIGAAALVLLLVAIGIVLLEVAWNFFWKNILGQKEESFKETGSTTARIAWEFVKTTKENYLCPLIDMPERPRS